MPRMRIAIWLLALALASCEERPRLEFGPCVPDKVRHVEWFGYLAGEAYLTETAAYSNLSWGSGATALPDARAAGVKAILEVQGVF